MLKRTRLPAIIAIYTAVEGFSHGGMFFVGYTWWNNVGYLLPPRTVNAIGFVCVWVASAAFLGLSYFVFRGRDWARRLLIWSSLLMGVAMCMSYWGTWRDQHGYRITSIVLELSNAVAFASMPFFFAALLSHPAVAQTFRPNHLR